MAKIKITLILAALALTGWRPLLEQKAEVARTLAACVMRSVVLEQSSFRQIDVVAARPVPERPTPAASRHPEKARRLAAAEKPAPAVVVRLRTPVMRTETEACTCPRTVETLPHAPVTISLGS